jgi:cell division protein DivIC
MKKFASYIPAPLTNKYLLTAVGFVVWLLFFDARDLLTTLDRQSELKALEKSRDHYITEIETTNKELEQLKNDAATLEKYAREKYRMKKDNEDLFIIAD